MYIFILQVEQNIQKNSLVGFGNCQIHGYQLGCSSNAGLDYLRQVSKGFAIPVLVSTGNDRTKKFHGFGSGYSNSWTGVAVCGNGQINLTDQTATYDPQSQTDDLLQKTARFAPRSSPLCSPPPPFPSLPLPVSPRPLASVPLHTITIPTFPLSPFPPSPHL